jgi:two-component system nitrogen regulation response regulator GlnG
MVEEGTFREDLYYRLNGFTIDLPPLREREGDVQLLIEHFLWTCSRKMDKEVHTIAPAALDLLLEYSWPGNVRELQSSIMQTLLQTIGPVVLPEFLPKSIREKRSAVSQTQRNRTPLASELESFIDQRMAAGSSDIYADTLEVMERCLLQRVLTRTDGNQSKAAKILGISRASLRHKLQALHISMEHVVSIGVNANGTGASDDEADE